MHFLTPEQWQAWCIERQVPLEKVNALCPKIAEEPFHTAKIPYPKDSGAKVYLAKRLFSLIFTEPESLILTGDWDVWPSSGHMPLFSRFREAFGEFRSVWKTPGHLVAPADADDAVSIIATSLFFIWDCYGISSTGHDAFHVSHDEYCYFASRDASAAKRVASEFAAS